MNDKTSQLRELSIPGETASEIEALQRMLHVSEGSFALGLATFKNAQTRRDVINILKEENPSINELTIPPRTNDVYNYIRRKVSRPRNVPLIITGLEESVPSSADSYPALRALNASRELWRNEFECPVVFCVLEYLSELMAEYAKDFWRWFSHRFDFTKIPSEAPSGMIQEYDGITSAANLDSNQKRLRIQELINRLEEIAEEPTRQLLSHVISWMLELATIYEITGCYDEAEKWCQKALEKAKAGKRLKEQGMIYNALSRIHIKRGQLKSAEEYNNRAHKIFEELGDRAGMATSLHNVGNIHYLRGEYAEALKYYRDALKIKEELGDRAGVASSLHQVGMIHEERGEYAEALKYYRKSLKIAEEIGDRSQVASSHGQMGQLLTEQGQYPEAFEHLLIALSLFQQLQSPYADLAMNDLKNLRTQWGADEFDAAWEAKTGEKSPF